MAPLPEQCSENFRPEIEEVLSKYARHVEFLGDDLKSVAQIGAFGSQVVHLASFADHCKDIATLVRAGASMNAIGDLGLRPLHYAVLGGAIKAVRFLLEIGADAGTENEFGETPAQMAHILGEAELEEMLLHVAGPSVFGYDGDQIARQRWLEFRSTQQANFWPDM
jgi:ankyrin repeat protein